MRKVSHIKDKQGFHYPILLRLQYFGQALHQTYYGLSHFCVSLDCNSDFRITVHMSQFKFGPKKVNFMDNTNVPQGGNGRVLRFDDN